MRRAQRAALAATIVASAFLLGSCAIKKVEWHPETQGSGVWYDKQNERIAAMRTKPEGAFELERFSLEPEKSRVSYLDFAPSGPHAFTCASNDALRIAIAGPILVFYGKNKDGSSFTEDYRAVDRAFLAKKAAEADKRRAAIAAKKAPSAREQEEAWILEMISQSLEGLELPE